MSDVLSLTDAMLVRRLAAHRELGLPELVDQLNDALGVDALDAESVGNRLRRLRRHGWTQGNGLHGERARWWLSDAGRRALRLGGDEFIATRPQQAQASANRIAPPRQVDVMHSPVWRPPAWQPARAGALDAVRLPSLGVRC